MVDILNENTGAIQAVATVVLVGVTIAYVLITKMLLDEARRAQRPYVYLDIAGEGAALLDIGIGNAGDRAAEHITFEVESAPDDLISNRPLASTPPFADGIDYLPPGRRYSYLVRVPGEVFEGAPGENVLKVKATYRAAGRSFTEDVAIDLVTMAHVRTASFAEPGAKIAKSLEGLRSDLKSERRSESLASAWNKACPFCAEPIGPSAQKCPHCLEWLPAPPPESEETAPVEPD